MQKLLLPMLVLTTCNFLLAQSVSKPISGNVSEDGNLLSEVTVAIEGSSATILTGQDGRYEIQAREGDKLQFSHGTMLPVQIVVEDVTQTLNVKMSPKVEKLKNVTVSRKILKSQTELFREYEQNPNLISTAFGILDKESSNFSLRILDAKEIRSGTSDLSLALQGKFAGVRTRMVHNRINGGISQSVTLRNGVAGFDIDGQFFREYPLFLDVQNIERIAVVSSASALTRYGSFGSGGMVIINTKTSNFHRNMSRMEADRRSGTQTDIPVSTVIAGNELSGSEPSYLKHLRATTTTKDATTLYQDLNSRYKNSPYFVLDMYQFFSRERGNEALAEEIVMDHWHLFKNDPPAMKALAYHYQAGGKLVRAHEILREVFILRPDYAQSYLDLANSYEDIGAYKKATSLYARFAYLSENGYFTKKDKGFQRVIQRDFYNHLARHGGGLITNAKDRMALYDPHFKGTRLVFEWNDGEAEFDLQFVNPENQSYVWEHSLKQVPDRITDEKVKGYSCEEFLIDNYIEGTWPVNVRYLGNKQLTPTYLKLTIYSDYGQATQSKQYRLFKLMVKDVNQHLVSLPTPGQVSLN